MTGARVEMVQFEDGGRLHKGRYTQEVLDAGECKEIDSSFKASEWTQLCYTLILAYMT